MSAAFKERLATLTREALRTAPATMRDRHHDTGHCSCARCVHVRRHIAAALHAEGGWTWSAIGAAVGLSDDRARVLVRGRPARAKSGAAA